MNNIILEDGYNTDYVYSLIISLFCSTNIYQIIKYCDTPDAYYICEYIKTKFVSPINKGMSINMPTINKFKLYLFNCGLCSNIIDKIEINIFYEFLINKIMKYYIHIINDDTYIKYNMITLTETHITDENNILNLSSMVHKWFGFTNRFKIIPYILPIHININTHDYYINVMEYLQLSDKTWKINSLICQNKNKEYYSIILNDNIFTAFSDKCIPSNWIIDLTDLNIKKEIMQSIKFVFYKLY